MNHFKPAEIERYVNTIWAIAASRFCKTFLIGYTAVPRYERHGPYRGLGWQHLVAIETGLTQDEALELEEILQGRCKQGDATGPSFRKKYAPSQRQDVYRRSRGNSKVDPESREHSVYMVWWEE